MSRLVEKNREEVADDMYDTARRVALVKKRVRDNTRRRQRRSVYGLSAACMLLFAALVQVESMAIERGQTAAQGAFGAMLLREDAGGYMLVAVAAFAAAVVLDSSVEPGAFGLACAVFPRRKRQLG